MAAKSEERVSCALDSPVGRLKVVASAEGVCAVTWLKESEEAEQETTDSADAAKARQHLKTCSEWLTAYFTGSLLGSPVPAPQLAIPTKSTFFLRVWSALCNTKIGETVTYGELAELAGKPGAARVVGQAMRKNSIPLLIPCHRVVKSGSGDLGNYSGGEGPSTKQWLIDHESKLLSTTSKSEPLNN